MRQTVFEPAWLDELAELRGTLTPAQLAEVTAGFVFRPHLWRPLVHHDPSDRWFERLLLTSCLEVWLIGWTPGQGTTVHDHGGSVGGMTVAEGALVEDVFQRAGPGSARRTNRPVHHEPGIPVGFAETRVHRVRNTGPQNATSVNAYSPPGWLMREYVEVNAGAVKVDDLLTQARSRLVRLQPREAAEARGRGALLVDIRPEAQRAREGAIPGALVIERNVLEWRLDPASPWRIPEADSHDREVVVFCSQGYTSSLAAASLQDLGLNRATDLVGGFQAWAAAGLPTESSRT
jgi:rhodanese-related sulfurtransferase/predicted metal-dependent enzyme (double-stranded beta helix superfamily)